MSDREQASTDGNVQNGGKQETGGQRSPGGETDPAESHDQGQLGTGVRSGSSRRGQRQGPETQPASHRQRSQEQRAPGDRGPQRGHRSASGTGLDPNVAAALSYLFGWVTGLVFLVVKEEDDFVRFHAAQSVVVFGSLTIGWVVFTAILASLLFTTGSFAVFRIGQLIQLLGLIAWLLLLYKAYVGQWFRVPIAADIADNIAAGGNRPAGRQQPQGRQPTDQQGQPANQAQPGLDRGQRRSGQPRSGGRPESPGDQ